VVITTKEGGNPMYEQDATMQEKSEDIKAKLSRLIKAIEERTEEIDYPLYCF
jgi:hypothetical protein